MTGTPAGRGLIITYHGIEPGPPPLFLAPERFGAHLEVLASHGATVLTVSQLAHAMQTGRMPPRAVALTFDDGFASVVEHAAPQLRRRGWPATVYCVSGHVGGSNDWPTQPAHVPKRPLASAAQLRELVADGWEIGAHTATHAPLSRLAPDAAREEVVGCRTRLEAATGAPVRSFAAPYGDPPPGAVRELVERTYDVCCSTRIGLVDGRADLHALPRVDAHYLRRDAMLARAVRGGGTYVALRGLGARIRRLAVRDFA